MYMRKIVYAMLASLLCTSLSAEEAQNIFTDMMEFALETAVEVAV